MEQESRPFISRFAVEAAFAIFIALFGAVIIKGALEFNTGWGDIGPEAGYFPFRVGILLILGSIVNLAWAFIRRKKLAVDVFLSREQGRHVVAFAVPVVVLVGVTVILGLYVGMALYLLFTVGLVGRHRRWVTITVAVGTPVILFLLFEYVFLTPLLKGPLEHLLGWY
ncbi:MAG: tripartite tricarboxylate transporter TctB family protein [Deltaproteobacteria bacterium]|nr:tripartite tricarboxylate transporter TctB family protein [Deltaproteobacteria bacterium]